MFSRKRKSSKAAPLTPSAAIEAARFKINEALDAAEGVAGRPALIALLQQTLENLKYISAVTAASAFEYAVPRELRRQHVIRVEAPPSRSTVEQVRDLIRGK
jgi:hypothetical protein